MRYLVIIFSFIFSISYSQIRTNLKCKSLSADTYISAQSVRADTFNMGISSNLVLNSLISKVGYFDTLRQLGVKVPKYSDTTNIFSTKTDTRRAIPDTTNTVATKYYVSQATGKYIKNNNPTDTAIKIRGTSYPCVYSQINTSTKSAIFNEFNIGSAYGVTNFLKYSGNVGTYNLATVGYNTGTYNSLTGTGSYGTKNFFGSGCYNSMGLYISSPSNTRKIWGINASMLGDTMHFMTLNMAGLGSTVLDVVYNSYGIINNYTIGSNAANHSVTLNYLKFNLSSSGSYGNYFDFGSGTSNKGSAYLLGNCINSTGLYISSSGDNNYGTSISSSGTGFIKDYFYIDGNSSKVLNGELYGKYSNLINSTISQSDTFIILKTLKGTKFLLDSSGYVHNEVPHAVGKFNDSTINISLTQNQWVQVNNPIGHNSFNEIKKVSFTEDKDTLIASVAGDYEIKWDINIIGSNSKTYQYRIMQRNGSEVEKWKFEVTGTGTTVLRTIETYISLVSGSRVWLEIRSISSAPGSVTLLGGQVRIKPVNLD